MQDVSTFTQWCYGIRYPLYEKFSFLIAIFSCVIAMK